jgi:hypothetical protein
MKGIVEYVHEKLDGVAGRILELLTGLRKYKVREVEVRVPDVRKVIDTRPTKHSPPSGPPCDRW